VYLEASWTGNQAALLTARAKFKPAIELYLRAIDLATQAESHEVQGKFHMGLALCYREVGNLVAAEASLVQSVDAFRKVESPMTRVAEAVLADIQTTGGQNTPRM
jgi:Flp pilus assembly protein TadD